MTAIEICVEDVAGARTAERHGADRIELCADLLEGGITPSVGMVATTLTVMTRIGVQVLIRPRGGDFVYDADESAVMRADIHALRALPRRVELGFVLSGLTPDGRVDRRVVGELVAACGDAPITFSRAFDEVADQRAELETLIDLGVHRVLTGGGPGPAATGVAALAGLVRQASGRIGILAAGGVRSGNVAALLAATGVPEVHLRAPGSSTAGDTAPADPAAGASAPGRERTSAAEVSAVVAAVRSAGPGSDVT